MRRVIMLIAIFVFVCGVSAFTATAQTFIALGSDSSSNLVFTSTGSGSSATLAAQSCTAGQGSPVSPFVASSNCLSGGVTGTTPNGSVASGTYELDFTPGGTVTVSGSGGGPYSITQTGNIALIMKNTDGTTALTGNLQLVNLGVLGPSGLTNYGFSGNLAITGGSLQSQFANSTGVVQVELQVSGDFGSVIDSNTAGQTTTGLYAQANVSNTPEPNSMLLFGTGLLGIGGILRRRLGLA